MGSIAKRLTALERRAREEHRHRESDEGKAFLNSLSDAELDYLLEPEANAEYDRRLAELWSKYLGFTLRPTIATRLPSNGHAAPVQVRHFT